MANGVKHLLGIFEPITALFDHVGRVSARRAILLTIEVSMVANGPSLTKVLSTKRGVFGVLFFFLGTLRLLCELNCILFDRRVKPGVLISFGLMLGHHVVLRLNFFPLAGRPLSIGPITSGGEDVIKWQVMSTTKYQGASRGNGLTIFDKCELFSILTKFAPRPGLRVARQIFFIGRQRCLSLVLARNQLPRITVRGVVSAPLVVHLFGPTVANLLIPRPSGPKAIGERCSRQRARGVVLRVYHLFGRRKECAIVRRPFFGFLVGDQSTHVVIVVLLPDAMADGRVRRLILERRLIGPCRPSRLVQ